jgi:hypothetical protein
MTAPPVPPESALDKWLQGAFEDPARVGTFDMIDAPDLPHFADFPRLKGAIEFLDHELRPAYERADANAMRHQATHRRVAKLAIASGGLAIGFAIIQLALLQTVPGWAGIVAWVEAVAVLAGVFAVALGLWARFDRNWLLQRHIAERLRMLKFRSLGRHEVWKGDLGAWREWVRQERQKISELSELDQVVAWLDQDLGLVEPEVAGGTDATPEDTALAVYYRWKRINFQAAYFDRQGSKLMSGTTQLLHHAGLPLFALTTLAAVLHFAIDLSTHQAGDLVVAGTAGGRWKLVGTWALAAAALLPVLSLCLRTWSGAFEYLRSAHLFKAKHHVLVRASADMAASQGDRAATVRQIASIEYTLEQEHREWLRLLRAAEWFL